MNALDFLVDFVALVDTPAASRVPTDGNGEHDASITRRTATASAPRPIVAVPPEIDDHNDEAALNGRAHYQLASPSTSHLDPFTATSSRESANVAQNGVFDAPFTDSHRHLTPQSFDQYRQKQPNLPCEFVRGEHQRYHYDCLPPWTACYAYGCAIPVFREPYRLQLPFNAARQLPSMPTVYPSGAGLPCEYPCEEKMCRCQHFPSYSYCVTEDQNEHAYNGRVAGGYMDGSHWMQANNIAG